MTVYAFPGMVGNVVTLTGKIESSWAEAVRDRAFQVFDTMADLVAGIGSPQVGQMAVITADGVASGVYQCVGAGDQWQLPWNFDWGRTARTVDTTLQSVASTAETVITAAATTFTAVANRLYNIRLNAAFGNPAAAAAVLTARIKDGTTLIEQARPATISSGITWPVSFSVETSLSAGSHTINVTMQSTNASGVNACGAGYPLVVDVYDNGPSGAPS